MLFLKEFGRSRWLWLISGLNLVGIVSINCCAIFLKEFLSVLVDEGLTIGLSLAKLQNFRFSNREGLNEYFLSPCDI
jgi:hypothetical protein